MSVSLNIDLYRVHVLPETAGCRLCKVSHDTPVTRNSPW